MSIRKLRAGRVPTVTASQYIGEHGTIFWDEGTGTLHLSDGHTPGGILLSVQTFTSENVPDNPSDGNLWFDSVTGKLYIWFENTWVDTHPAYVLPTATSSVLGGIKVGPGVNISNQGILTIDAAGLPISFGDFTASTNNLSVINTDEDLNLLSNGNGGINVVGKFHVHSTTGGLSDTPVLSIDDNGFTIIHIPTINTGQAGLTINGDSAINSATLPQVAGTTFRSIGNDGVSNIVAIDANGTGITAGMTARVARGTADTPTAVQLGDTIGRFAAVGWGSTNYAADPISGRAPSDIRFVATENYTDAHAGTKIQFYTSPTGGTVRTLSAEISTDGVNLPASGSGVTFSDTSKQTTAFIPAAISNSLVPSVTNASLNLGSPTHRWGDVYVGPNSLHMQDTTTLADVAITVDNGTVFFNGVQNLTLGDLTIVGNTLKAIVPSTNINIGDIADTGLATIGRQTVITTPNLGSFTAALLINGATTLPIDPSPLTFNGTLVHGVAQAGQNARLVFDTFGSGLYNSFVGRYARGTVASPTAVRQNDIILRISANGYGSTGFAAAGSARIDFVADDNFTDTTRGTQIDFWTTPPGTTTITKNASVNSDGFVGTGIRFTGDNTYQTTAGIPLTQKAVPSASYVATLGVDGKLDASQIPSSLTGAVVFKGVWDASTNTPTLSDSLPTGLQLGWEYVVSVTGTRDIGDGSTLYTQGDFVIFDGVHWKVVRGANSFTSLTGGGHITVNQSTGVMILGSDATPTSTVSTIVSRDSSGNFSANIITAALSGSVTGNVTGNVSGNAGTVTNGVYTTGSYSDPSWLTISKSKVGLSAVENTALSTSTHYIGTTSIQYNRASASQTLTGVSIDGNAATATNGVVTTGSYSDPSWLTLSKSKVGLSNVDNTADANKNVLYATTAGGAPATDVYAWAKAATKPSYTKSEVGLSAVENTALSTWAGTSNITTVGTLTSGTIGSGFTAIDNARLAHSTISGVSLGNTLNALTAGTNISFSSGTTYDGSAAITINFASTVAVAGNSWTPTLIFATQGSQTYTAQYGNYIKNGRSVTCYFTISTSAQTGTGAMSIGGLPFTSATSTHGPVGSLQVTALTTGGGVGATDFMGTGTVASASTTVPVYGFTSAGGGTFAAITGAEYGTGTTSISGYIQYITAS